MSSETPIHVPPTRGRWHRWAPGGTHTSVAMVWGLGAGEILLVAGVVVFFFGAKKIPEIAQGLGRGIRNFKGELKPGDEPEEGGVPDERTVPPERDRHRD